MKIKIQLYRCFPPDNCKKFKKIIIKGKIAEYFSAPVRADLSDYEQGKNLFDYYFDNTYKAEFSKLKLNYRFIFFHNDDGDEMSDLSGKEPYAHLNFLQKTYLNWIFKKSWILKSENIKWLIGISLSVIIALLIAFLKSLF